MDEGALEIKMSAKSVLIANKVVIGGCRPFVLIAGPCVIENHQVTYQIAKELKEITNKLNIPFIFKASYDKANRTSLHSFRGMGIRRGLDILAKIRMAFRVPVISDVHCESEISEASDVLDIIQIPALLSRQTDLIQAVAKTGKPINIKKGQFLAPWDIRYVIEKVTDNNNKKIMITERGTTFGYNNLIVDFRNFELMREFGYPIIFDVTHSVQLPGGAGSCSGGQREFVPPLARAAIAAGVDGIFLEVHPDPDKALCDGANSIKLSDVEKLLKQLLQIEKVTYT